MVQWDGLAPEDTSWEDWTTLRDAYHLEDKVLSQGGGNDSSSPIEDGPSNSTLVRPKRNTSRPQGWNDYVH